MNFDIQKIIEHLQDWFFYDGITILLILLITFFLAKFMRVIVTRIVRRLVPHSHFKNERAEKRREDTLITIIGNFLKFFIWVVAIFSILFKFGVPVAPLLTGAGILGVAVGFGAQSLVKDVITGLFIIAENQFRINDFVCVGEHCGNVESMTLRTTKLRALDGSLHYIPNSEITILSNKSRDYANIHLKIGVGYDTDFDNLEVLINKVGNEIAADPAFADSIIEAPQFLRIDDFLDSSVNIHIIGRVNPETQYRINGELRRRLKIVFDKNGIDIPYPIRIMRNPVEEK